VTSRCHRCGAELEKNQFVRGDRCHSCEADTRCCRNCEFDDPSFGTQCREPQAEAVSDRESANFCEFFEPRRREGGPRKAPEPGPSKNRASFDDLFKKKG
jgi:hypothetical protein